MDLQSHFDPPTGDAQWIAPNVRRIVAPNPSPMTFRGTNTYLVGHSEIAVIDPGPKIASHLDAILDSLTPTQRITHIIVTHAHLDHSQLVPALKAATGATVYGFGAAHAGRSAVMQQLAADGMVGGGEGIDEAFLPDVIVPDEGIIDGAGWSLRALHTPGHIGNHLCLSLGDACFTGDHVMGWATSTVSPPDGDLTDFMMSSYRLAKSPWRIFFPGHGAPVEHPNDRLSWLIEHRLARERAILDVLSDGAASADEVARCVYSETPKALLPAASRNVFAHLIDLQQRGLTICDGPLSFEASFRRQRT